MTDQSAQTLAVVDLRSGRCTKRIPVGGQPLGIVVTADTSRAFVSQYAGDFIDGRYTPGSIAVVDLQSEMVIKRISVPARPFALALTADGKSLLVTHYFHIDGRGIVSDIDTEKLSIRRQFVLSADDDTRGGRGGIFNALSGIAIHPSKSRALVIGMHANTLRGVSQSGRALSHKTTVQAAARLLDLDTGSEIDSARIVSSFSGQAVAVPSAIAFAGQGEYFIDVYFASHDVKVLRYNERGLVAERALLELPHGPAGVALSRDGRDAFFLCRWDRSLVHVSLEDIRRPRILKTLRSAESPGARHVYSVPGSFTILATRA